MPVKERFDGDDVTPERLERREFLTGTVAMAFSPLLPTLAADGCGSCFSFLHATDLHMTENPDIERGALQMKDKFMGPCFIDAVNELAKSDPGVAFIALTGDLTSGVGMDPSCWPFAERKWRHYRKYVTDRLHVPWHQIIGNNDCAEVPYRKAFPGCPVRWTFDRGGVRFVGLHGYDLWTVDCTNHAGILYGREQLEWLNGLVSGCESETLVLFTHEPLQDPDSHRARKQLAPILAKFRGKYIWNICGHNHWNSDAIIRVGTRDVRVVQTMTPVGEWSVGDGVYRSFAVKNGRIVSSDLHWLTKDGEPIRVGKSPDWDSPRRVEMIEETLPRGSLAFGLVGESGLLALLGGCYQDRLSDYYLKPHGGIASWVVNPKGASRVRFAIAGRLEGWLRVRNAEGEETSIPVSLSPENSVVALPGQICSSTSATLTLCNESKYEFKLFGYALS